LGSRVLFLRSGLGRKKNGAGSEEEHHNGPCPMISVASQTLRHGTFAVNIFGGFKIGLI
jgi:hypothetical protein